MFQVCSVFLTQVLPLLLCVGAQTRMQKVYAKLYHFLLHDGLSKTCCFYVFIYFLSVRRELASNVDKVFAADFLSDSPCNLAFSAFALAVLLLKMPCFFRKNFLFQVIYVANIYSYSCKFGLSVRDVFFQLRVLDTRLCLHLKNVIFLEGKPPTCGR